MSTTAPSLAKPLAGSFFLYISACCGIVLLSFFIGIGLRRKEGLLRNSRGFGGTELLILTVFLGLVVVILHFRHENEECKQKELRATAELAPIAEEVGSWYRTKGELPGDAFMLRWILHWGIADYPGRPDNPFGGFMTIYDVGPGGATSDHNADQILPGNAGYYVVETGDTGYVCIFGKNAGVIADTTIVIPG